MQSEICFPFDGLLLDGIVFGEPPHPVITREASDSESIINNGRIKISPGSY
jgi:hypothetical protein